jgi:TRAP-type C4-dicarboxylate transport system substrate-binding protein
MHSKKLTSSIKDFSRLKKVSFTFADWMPRRSHIPNAQLAPVIKASSIRAILLALATTLPIAVPAAAYEQRVLKIAHIFPATHYLWLQGGRIFANEVEKTSGGNIKFQAFPAGQLGKDNLALLRSGLAEMSILVPSYAPDKLPLSSVAELPSLFASSCEGTAKFWNVMKPGGVVNKTEYQPQGIHVLFVSVLPPYPILTTSKATPTLETLSGLKIRANGAAMDKTIRALGGMPVRLSSPDFYDSLSRGTLDGGIYPYQGLPTYDLQKLLKYSTTGAKLGAGTVVYAISTKTWLSLSEGARTIFTKAAASTQASLCKWQDEDDTKVQKQLVTQAGHSTAVLTPQEAARWNAKLAPVASAWAKEMDAAGKRGTEVLRAFSDNGSVSNISK